METAENKVRRGERVCNLRETERGRNEGRKRERKRGEGELTLQSRQWK